MKEYLALSLKGFMSNRIRGILVIIMVCISTILINTYVMMSNCIVDLESMKAENNIQFRKITITPYDAATRKESGIRVYDLYDIKQIPHVESVCFGSFDYGDESKYNFNKIIINNIELSEFVIDDRVSPFSLGILYQNFDAYNISLAKNIKNERNRDVIVSGVEPEADKYEVMLDFVTAKRFFQTERYDEICGRNIIFKRENGEEVLAAIVGIYDYLVYSQYKSTYSTEEMTLISNFESYIYDDEEIQNNDFTSTDINYPILISEALALELYRTSDNVYGRLPAFEKYYGTVDVMIDDIDNVEVVMQKLNEYGYYVESKVDMAKNAVDKFFFYKKMMLIIGIMLATITIIQMSNLMSMIINERKKYMDMLWKLGYLKWKISDIVSGEIVYMGLIGGLCGILITYCLKFVFLSQIRHALEESGLYRYIDIDLPVYAIVLTVISIMCICYIIGKISSLIVMRSSKEIN
ncbi:MAG: ABC transporter permease [Butyrivibrio sp.]